MARILGVDLGARRIGLALSDPTQTIASPHSVLERTGDPAADRRAIVDAANEAEAVCIVVGLPRQLSGKKGEAARLALDEIEALREVAGDAIEVVAFDERLTTVIAQRSLVEGGLRRADRKEVVDKVAAAVILQGYLEHRR